MLDWTRCFELLGSRVGRFPHLPPKRLASPAMNMPAPDKQAPVDHALIDRVCQFVKDEVLPVATRLEHADEYPAQIVEGFKRLRLFGCNVPCDFRGVGAEHTAVAGVIEERG